MARISQGSSWSRPKPAKSLLPLPSDTDHATYILTHLCMPQTSFPFLSLPIEIRLNIFTLLFSSPCFPNATSILQVCKSLYIEAKPIFLGRYLFNVIPIKSGPTATYMNVFYRLPSLYSVGLMRKIVWRGDDDPEQRDQYGFCTPFFRPGWARGFRSVIETLFGDFEPDPEEDERQRNEKEEIVFDPPEMSWKIESEHRGEMAGLEWCRSSKLANQILKMGKENAGKVECVRVLWGEDERLLWGGFQDTGAWAVAIMSILCEVWFTGVKRIELRYAGEGRVGLEHVGLPYGVDEKQLVMGGEEDDEDAVEGKMVKALRMLLARCRVLEELRMVMPRLSFEGSLMREEWWHDVTERERAKGLKVYIEQRSLLPTGYEDQ